MVPTVANAVTVSVNPTPTQGTALESTQSPYTDQPAPQRPLGTDKEAIKAAIMATFPDHPEMLNIAIVESTLRPWIDNPDSTASGLFQILDGTWIDYACTGNPHKAEDNIACTRKIVDKRGTKDWTASKDKWYDM